MEFKNIDYLQSGLSFRPTKNNLINIETLSINSGITALQEKPKIALFDNDLQQLLSKNSLLISTIRPLLNKTFTSFSDKTTLLLLTDRDGYIIDLMSCPEIIHLCFMNGIMLGGNMSYSSFGTNAISISMQEKCPISLLGNEHFCNVLHPFNCFAAPLQINNEIVGFLSVSSLEAKNLLYLISIIILLVDLIEIRLKYILHKNYQNNKLLCTHTTDYKNTLIKDKINFYGTLMIHSNLLFTIREIEVLCLLYNKRECGSIIKELCITRNTFKTHLKNIYQKLDVNNLTNCLLKVNGLLEKTS